MNEQSMIKMKAYIKANMYKTREGTLQKLVDMSATNALTNDEYSELVIVANEYYDSLESMPEVAALKVRLASVEEILNMLLMGGIL